jgi:hypothetical protein
VTNARKVRTRVRASDGQSAAGVRVQERSAFPWNAAQTRQVRVHQGSQTLYAYLHVGRAGVGEKVCCSAVQSQGDQYAGAGGKVRSAGIKNENPWAIG